MTGQRIDQKLGLEYLGRLPEAPAVGRNGQGYFDEGKGEMFLFKDGRWAPIGEVIPADDLEAMKGLFGGGR